MKKVYSDTGPFALMRNALKEATEEYIQARSDRDAAHLRFEAAKKKLNTSYKQFIGEL